MSHAYLKLVQINKPKDMYAADDLDKVKLRKHADALVASQAIPSVVVFDDGCRRWLASNPECYHATRRHWNGSMNMEILCDVRKGTQQDAVKFYRALKR